MVTFAWLKFFYTWMAAKKPAAPPPIIIISLRLINA